MSISKHIIELLYNHDCVIIPGFGAFLTKSISASHNNDIFSPPKKTLRFNGMLKENDGLLANEISSKEKISYNDAVKKIKKEVKVLLSSLDNREVDIDSIGVFKLNAEKKIQFQPNQDANFDSTSFGLESFMRKPKKVSTPEEKVKPLNVPDYAMRYAAIILLLVGISSISYISFDDYQNDQKLKSVANAQKEILKNVQTATFDLGEYAKINIPIKKNIIPAKSNSIYYSVIAGSFRSMENANKKLNSLIKLGYQASFTSINPKGLHRVAYARLKNRNEAVKLIATIKKEKGNDAWLLIEN